MGDGIVVGIMYLSSNDRSTSDLTAFASLLVLTWFCVENVDEKKF